MKYGSKLVVTVHVHLCHFFHSQESFTTTSTSTVASLILADDSWENNLVKIETPKFLISLNCFRLVSNVCGIPWQPSCHLHDDEKV